MGRIAAQKLAVRSAKVCFASIQTQCFMWSPGTATGAPCLGSFEVNAGASQLAYSQGAGW
jgi:hypothetical protein